MRKGKFIAVVLTILFAMTIPCFFYLGKQVSEKDPISFYVQSGDNSEKIKCWENEGGTYYVFLPSYADMSNVTISVSSNTDVYINDVSMKSGTVCEPFLLDTEYTLSGFFRDEPIRQKIVFVRSANVPTMYIDTLSGSMDHIHETKGNKEPGLIRIYENNGEQIYNGEIEAIKGRGNTTWYASKKPYSLRLSVEGNLMNLGAAQNWILLANTKDDTHLLNKLAYDLAKSVGMPFTPDCEWVDLYLNGEYVGLYLLAERIEVHPERVDISSSDGFLVSKEVQSRLEDQNYPHIVTQNNMALRIHHSSAREKELLQIWQTAVDAILKEGDWQSIIDMDSWAMRMLIDEVFGNGDGGLVSQFYYGNLSDRKIYAGPVWDMDLCLAQTGWPGGYANMILMCRDQLSWNEESLWGKLYKEPVFHDRLVQIFQTSFCPVICELLEEKYMTYALEISQAAFLNHVRWNTEDFQNEVQENYDFLKERIAFLNSYWMEEESYCRINIEPGFSGVWGCFAVKKGDWIPSVCEDNADGWCVFDTEESFDITQPIYEDVTIFHRDNVELLFKLYEEKNEEIVISDNVESIKLQRVLPIYILIFLMFLLIVLDVLRRKNKMILQ